MRFVKYILVSGLAMFSMFFGSGNLIFPILVGSKVIDKAFFAALGLSLTGVLIPFIGVISVIIYNGNYKNFFIFIGKRSSFFLTFIMLSLMGPFGVIPRCIIVAYRSIQLWLPNLSFEFFCVVFILLIFLIFFKKNKIIPLLGYVFTPLLIIGVSIIIISGFLYSEKYINSNFNAFSAFNEGLLEGYQTMDLFAAFFFSSTSFNYLSVKLNSDNKNYLKKLSILSTMIAMFLLFIVYVSMIFLGANYSLKLKNIPSEQLLIAISSFSIGQFSIPIVSITVATACLTTTIILIKLWADFLKENILKNKINTLFSVFVTLIISLLISYQGFEAIRYQLGSILNIMYPAIIVLVSFSILKKIFLIKENIVGTTFWISLVISIIYYLNYFELVKP